MTSSTSPASPAPSTSATVPGGGSRLPYGSLLVLSLCVFALCSSEYVLVGLLVDIARDLGTSISTVGALLTAYALTAAVAGPIVSLTTTRVSLKRLILALMTLFAVANVVIGFTDSYPILVAARSVAAIAHSTFAAACIIVGVRLAPEGRTATAISWVTAGFSAATVLGGPIGALLGALSGWRSAFLAVAAANLVGAAAMWMVVPHERRHEPAGWREQLRTVCGRRVLSGLLVAAVAQAAWFAPYGYLIALLTGSSGLGAPLASAMLLVFGVGNVLGNLTGGKLTDMSLHRTVMGLLAALAVALFLLTLVVHSGVLACVAVLLTGLFSGALIPAFNTWVLTAAGENSVLSLTLTTSAFNLGNGIGAAVAGVIVAAGGIDLLGAAGAVIALVALGAVIVLRSNGRSLVGVRV